MFRRNEGHRQTAMFSSIYELPEKQLKRLEESWAGVFYEEFFTRVEEELYDLSSDPNEQVNLAADPDYSEELEKMRELLSEHMRATEDPFLDKPFTFDFVDHPEIVEPLKPSEKTY